MTTLLPPTWNTTALFSSLDARNQRSRHSWQDVLLVFSAGAMVSSASVLAYLAVHALVH